MPSITSTNTTSPSSFSTAYWATVAPTLPAPTTVIFGLAIRASPCSGSSPCWPSVRVSLGWTRYGAHSPAAHAREGVRFTLTRRGDSVKNESPLRAPREGAGRSVSPSELWLARSTTTSTTRRRSVSTDSDTPAASPCDGARELLGASPVDQERQVRAVLLDRAERQGHDRVGIAGEPCG